MNRIGNKKGGTLFLLLLAGVVLGGFLGQLAEGIKGIQWLNYGQSFGLTQPFVLDLGVLVLTFAFKIRITIASIVGILLSVFIYRKI